MTSKKPNQREGTKKGCKTLSVPLKGKTVELSALPKPVQRLKPHHAENFLCIYKDSFEKSCGRPKGC